MKKGLMGLLAILGGIGANLLYRRYVPNRDKDVNKRSLLYDASVDRCKCFNEHCMCKNNRKELL